MDLRSRDCADLFPVLDGDPVDTCTRLRAELHPRRTITMLTVHGEIDAYTQKWWRYILDTALSTAQKSRRLAVDVDDASFLGCGAILDLAKRAQLGAVHGVQVSVIDAAPSTLDRVIAITGLAEWLPVHADLAEMLRPAA
ncbi:STAS domain-containing protein [Nocardia ignorata]|uniref:STAS domain-containing protein n=1 Tax=Nocardia ignorata TaxID=145285 RepID=UPI0036362574